MAIASSQEATSWASRCAYDVFLSFRGEDTRTKFTDHLYTACIGAGFRTFRDNEGIERGENIKSELQRAIQRSRISLVVISENYAYSGWCLDELVLILECKGTSGHVILPLFYDVDPSHVRKQIGVFAVAFKVHEEKYNRETNPKKGEWMGKLEGWKAALREVADLGGMVLQNEADRHESKFIQKVIKVVQDKLRRTALSVAPYLIGIEGRVRKIDMWLNDDSTDASIMVIFGMGGIGKTTIAKHLYNLNFERFEGSSFLASVNDYSEQTDGLVRLQRQLLSDILKEIKIRDYSEQTLQIRNIDEGIIKIRKVLRSKRVLLVVDDVDQRDQLNAILGMQDGFYPGSKVILTTRNERLLKAHEVYMVHEVDKLKYDESLELFSWHVFGQNRPIDGFVDHSKNVVDYCGGLPLAIQVLGSSLSGRSVDIWESAVHKLKFFPDDQILKKLRISYNNLQDSHDKNLFLDITCFLVGEDIDNIITILDGCGYYTKVGVQNLIDRCLLRIDQDKKVTMHQLIREMGREIIRHESPKEPEKRSRLCHHKDCIKVLRAKTGMETLEGLSMDFFISKEKNKAETFSEGYIVNMLSRVTVSMLSDPIDAFSSSHELEYFDTDAFSGMLKLRLLQLKSVRLDGDYKSMPSDLRWLCWRGFSLKYIPDGFPLENLVCLDMQHSSLKQVWKRRKLLRFLKIIDLSYSPLLELTPVFSGLPNLVRLSLRYCLKLAEIHESIGELERLLLLNLEGCKNLQKLPTNFAQLKSLEKLVLSGCSKLNDVPFDLGQMENLTVFHASGTTIYQTPCGNEEAKSSSSIFWPWKQGTAPEPVKFSLSSLCRSLVNLSLARCNLTDDALPKDLGCLPSLQNLNLSGNRISSLPESIKGLTMLQTLGLEGCKNLQSLPQLPSGIIDLMTGQCDKLVEARGLFKLAPIGETDAQVIKHFGLVDLESIGKIEVGIFSNMSISKRVLPLQGLSEFGIYSISLPRGEVPAGFSYKTSESSLCFNVPPLFKSNAKIIGLNICAIYARAAAEYSHNRRKKSWNEFYIKVSNETKNLKWVYSPTFVGVPDDDGQDMAWLCHWKFENKLENDDEVNISVYLWKAMKLKELRVHVVYEKQDEPPGLSISAGANLSPYDVRKGSYFLCHHDLNMVQMCSLDGGGWYDFLFGEVTNTI